MEGIIFMGMEQEPVTELNDNNPTSTEFSLPICYGIDPQS